MVLILDKQLQHLPWESCSVLLEQNQSVSRLPSLHFLLARLSSPFCPIPSSALHPDPRSGFFIINPSGDLSKTQEQFERPFREQRGWEGIAGRPPSRSECMRALMEKDVFVYCGHSGGERYLKPDDLKAACFEALVKSSSSSAPSSSSTSSSESAPSPSGLIRAHVLLIGCSSGLLQYQGSYDAQGVALAYLLAGCPAMVANLWDVTDGEIDRFCDALLAAWLPPHAQTGKSSSDVPPSLSFVLPSARQACNLPFLTGAAPVLYGLPSHAFIQ